jgi:hypothetical protein
VSTTMRVEIRVGPVSGAVDTGLARMSAGSGS